LLENVPGIAFSAKDEGLDFLRREIDKINRDTHSHYSFDATLLRATEFGVPQERYRVFIVGSRDGVEFKFPSPTHRVIESNQGDWLSAAETRAPVLTAWDAIGDLQDEDDPVLKVTGKWARLLPSIPEGANYLHHTARGQGLELFGWRSVNPLPKLTLFPRAILTPAS
jgi:DNA (cytosine-5)-methyltransferase 1